MVDDGNRKDGRVAGIGVSDALDRDVEIKKEPIVLIRTKRRIQKIAARHIPCVTGFTWSRLDMR
jgi:hypothetical protein